MATTLERTARSDAEPGRREEGPAMKYLLAWALGVPGIVILAWMIFF